MAADGLREARPECPYIISRRGQSITEAKTAWDAAPQAAGLPNINIHDLRRTAARNMIRAGVPEKQVMAIVRWKTRAMFDRYNTIDERDYHAAGARMESYFAEKVAAEKVRIAQESDEVTKSYKGIYIQ